MAFQDKFGDAIVGNLLELLLTIGTIIPRSVVELLHVIVPEVDDLSKRPVRYTPSQMLLGVSFTPIEFASRRFAFDPDLSLMLDWVPQPISVSGIAPTPEVAWTAGAWNL